MRTLIHDSGKHTELLFSNFTEFVSFAEAQSIRHPYATGNDTNFDFRHTRNLDECLALARTGWSEGRKAITKIADKLNVSSRLAIPELYFDVTGEYGHDIGRILSGEAESAFCYRDSDNFAESTNGPIIKIIVNAAISAMVDKEIYMQRGAAIVALIDTLETAGKQVELNVVWTSTLRDKTTVTLNVPLKGLGQHVQTDQIAFALAHPSFVRRLCFIAHGSISQEAKTSAESYCGRPAEYELGAPDVYMPRMYGLESQWETLEACQEWTIAKLAEFGVILSTE